MSVRIDTLQSIFKRCLLTDVYVTGFIDMGSCVPKAIWPLSNSLEFHPMWNEIYLHFTEALVRCRIVERCSRMSVSVADRIECAFDIDPEDTFGVTSIFPVILQSNRESAQVNHFECFIHSDCDPDSGIVAALGLTLDQADYVFIDSLGHNGIHLGTVQLRERWIARYGSDHSVASYAVSDRAEDIARHVIQRVDPLGLYSHGKGYEYAREARAISQQVSQIHSASDAVKVIADVLTTSLGRQSAVELNFEFYGRELFRALKESSLIRSVEDEAHASVDDPQGKLPLG